MLRVNRSFTFDVHRIQWIVIQALLLSLPSVRRVSFLTLVVFDSLPLNPGNEAYPIRPTMSALSVFPTSLCFAVSGCEI